MIDVVVLKAFYQIWSSNNNLMKFKMIQAYVACQCRILRGFKVVNRLRWYGHVLRKDDDDWVKKCTEYEVEGPRPRGRPKRTWKEVV